MKTVNVIYFQYMANVPEVHEVQVKREFEIEEWKCILHRQVQNSSLWAVSLFETGIIICHHCMTMQRAMILAKEQIEKNLGNMDKAVQTSRENLKKWGFQCPLNLK